MSSSTPDWARPIHKRILRILHQTKPAPDLPGLWLKPSIVAYNLDATTPYVNTELIRLADHDLVDHQEGGWYRINHAGIAFLNTHA